MKKVGYIFDDIFLLHEMPAGHPESRDRLISINETLKQSGIWDKVLHLSPGKAGLQDILAVHSGHYVEKVMPFTGYYDPDTYISVYSVEAALFAAGAVIEALEGCRTGRIERAFCSVRPPGIMQKLTGPWVSAYSITSLSVRAMRRSLDTVRYSSLISMSITATARSISSKRKTLSFISAHISILIIQAQAATRKGAKARVSDSRITYRCITVQGTRIFSRLTRTYYRVWSIDSILTLC